MICYFDLLTFL